MADHLHFIGSASEQVSFEDSFNYPTFYHTSKLEVLKLNRIADIEQRLSRSSLIHPISTSPKGRTHDDAAVIILIRPDEEGLKILFEKRVKSSLDRWSAQIAFPGGRFNPSDLTLDKTACREFFEETGFDTCSKFRLIGYLNPFHPANQREINVFPFISIATEDVTFRPNKEVEELFWIPVERMRYKHVKVNTYRGMIETKALTYEDKIIWGMTQRILESLASILGIVFSD